MKVFISPDLYDMGDPPMIYQSDPGPGKLFLESDPALNYRRYVSEWNVYEVGARVKELDATVRASHTPVISVCRSTRTS